MSSDVLAPITPDERAEIDRALRGWDGCGRVGHVTRLGGMTNRNYRVEVDGRAVALRIPGPGREAFIDRDADQHNAALAATLGIGPRVLHAHDGVMVRMFIEGRPLQPADFNGDPVLLARAGRLLRTIHDSDCPLRGRVDPAARIAGHRAELDREPPGTDDLIEAVGALPHPAEPVPCHGDPWPENFIDTGDRLHLIDWEYSGMGDRAWDLADLAVEADLDVDATAALLDAYTAGARDPALVARVDRLRPVTDVLWGLWALVQERAGGGTGGYGPYARQRLDRAARALAGHGDH